VTVLVSVRGIVSCDVCTSVDEFVGLTDCASEYLVNEYLMFGGPPTPAPVTCWLFYAIRQRCADCDSRPR